MRRSAWLPVRDGMGRGLSVLGLTYRLTYVAVLLGLIAALVGAGHLVDWPGGYLSQRGLSAITMKTNAALCLTLVGVALRLLIPAGAGGVRRWSARICAGLALLVGLLTVVENVSGWNLGINQLLATETPGAIGVVSPNQMGLPASVSFTLIGLALLFLSRQDRQRVEKAVQEALRHGRFNPEFRIIQEGGDERYIHGQGQATFDQGGHPVKREGTLGFSDGGPMIPLPPHLP